MLVGAHDHDADTLSDAELISMLWGMLLGGFSTTAATIDHAVLVMLGYPEQRHWLQGDAVGVKALVEEVLRRDSPVMFSTTMRIARRDIELGGVVIPKNTDVPVLIAAGNRDPDAFADPDRFDPARFYGTSPGMSTDGKIMLSFGTASAAASVRNWPGCSWPRACRGSRRASPRWHWLSRRPGSPPSSLGRSARCRCCCMRRGAEMRVVIDQDLRNQRAVRADAAGQLSPARTGRRGRSVRGDGPAGAARGRAARGQPMPSRRHSGHRKRRWR
ncbi:hypothetical protein ABIA94_008837 [Bradyrhizobium sp. LA7.1]